MFLPSDPAAIDRPRGHLREVAVGPLPEATPATIEVIAHRGAAHGSPENTIVAFERAIEQGSHGLELDVWPTADGAAVVVHDEKLGRTIPGAGRVDALTWGQLRRLDAGGTGRPPPLLDEVLELARDRVWLDVELKSVGAVEPAVAAIADAAMGDRCVITSFDVETLERVRVVAPELRRGLVQGQRSLNPAVRWNEALPQRLLRSLDAWCLVSHHRILWRAVVRSVHRMGKPVYVWTSLRADARGPERTWARLVRLGVDGIITGRPGDLARFLEGMRGLDGRGPGPLPMPR